ncbi:TPA: hypothetical protein U5E40_001343 [Yersinia enterocolitica]|nr:hypothetical protein [Yersinia enterocolitica]
MKITRSVIESDMNMILESVQSYDYEIPSTKEIMSYPLKVLIILYSMQLAMFVVSFTLHTESINQSLLHFLFAMLFCVLPSLMIVLMSYSNVSIYLCLEQTARDKSVLINYMKAKLKGYLKVYFMVNFTISLLYTIYFDWGYLAVSVSFFVTTLIFGFLFSTSLSRYFTPGVFAVIGKIKEILSPSAPVTVEK